MKVAKDLEQKYRPITSACPDEVLAGCTEQSQNGADFPTKPSALSIVVGPERVTGRAISIDKAEQHFKDCISGNAQPKRYDIQSMIW